MSLEKLMAVTSRLFFLGAFVLLALAVIERIANAAGYTILHLYQKGRMLEVAAVFLLVVMTMQLREIKKDLRSRRP